MKVKLAIDGGKPLFNSPVSYRWPLIDRKGEKAVIEQLHRGLSIYDKSGVVGRFEDEFASIHNKKYGLVTSSGTAALHSIFYALKIGIGDEVICPSYTFFATAAPLLQLGALPVLADCQEYGNIDPKEIERLLTNRTKAVIITHMWGLPCDMDEIVNTCIKHNLYLLEDCSHAHGASYKGKLVGTFGKAAIWSLQTQKLIAAGEGGVLLTDDQELYDRAQLLGHFNKRAMKEISQSKPYYKYAVTGLGLKYRAHPLGIAFALTQLPRLKKWIQNKQVNAKRIRQILAEFPMLRPMFPDIKDRLSSYYAFPILFNEKIAGFSREKLVTAVQAEGFADIDIPKSTAPLHTLATFNEPISPVTKYIENGVRGKYPNSKEIFSKLIKVSVPVETGKNTRGTRFLENFQKVLLKVVSNLR